MGKALLDRENVFIMKNTDITKKAFYFWIRERYFDEYADGWKDKKGNPGIALRANRVKIGIIICTEDTEQYVKECITTLEKESEENAAETQIV